MATTTGLIDVRTKYIAPAEATLPALGVHITRLVDSYMVWVGVTEERAETVEDAPRKGLLCRDWACAMPSAPGNAVSVCNEKVSQLCTERSCMQHGAGAATTLYRTSASDVAFSMAQRLGGFR